MDREHWAHMLDIPTLRAAIQCVTAQRAEYLRDGSNVADVDAWLVVAHRVLEEKTDE
jgi:hypothetical protein